MPIPAEAGGEGSTNIVLSLFSKLHQQLRHETSGLDGDALNWEPTDGANSIATIVVHLVGSEAETLRAVAGLAGERDRDAEFRRGTLDCSQVSQLLNEADDLLREVSPHIGTDRLEAMLILPTLPTVDVRPGLTWLVGNCGHAREHLGHIQLTRQLYQSRNSSGSGENPIS